MNSFRPVATVAILAVIGIGLYMVINTSEPIPPEDAADAMLAVPQIEDDLAGFVDEGTPHTPTEVTEGGVGGAADGISGAPAWSSPVESAPPSWPAESAAPALPQDPAVPQSPTARALPHSADASLQASLPGVADGAGRNGFSVQLQSQMQGATAPPIMENPHVQPGPASRADWGSIPSADVAEQVTSSHSVGTAAGSPVGPSPRDEYGIEEGYSNGLPAVDDPRLSGAHSALPPIEGAPASGSTAFTVAWAAAHETLRRGDLSQALLMLSEYWGDPQLTPAETNQLQELLGQLAGTVIYSTSHELEEPYRVQPGETLTDIADRYEVTPELLAKINGLADPNRLAPGTELKVVRGPFHAIVEPTGLRLILHGRYAGRFSVQGPPIWPAEAWTVQQKVPAAGPSGSAATSAGKHLVLAPAEPDANVPPVTVAADVAARDDTRPVVRVSAHDLTDLYDILTIGSRVTVRR